MYILFQCVFFFYYIAVVTVTIVALIAMINERTSETE